MDGSELVVCEADKKMLDPALDPANNKMASGQDWSYDAAGGKDIYHATTGRISWK